MHAAVFTCCRLLLSVDRGRDSSHAMLTVQLAAKWRDAMQGGGASYQGHVLGVDFSGNPYITAVEPFLPALKRAKELGLKLSLHISEVRTSRERGITPCLYLYQPSTSVTGTFHLHMPPTYSFHQSLPLFPPTCPSHLSHPLTSPTCPLPPATDPWEC